MIVKMVLITLLTINVSSGHVEQSKAAPLNHQQFAQSYFDAWTATQSPTATKADLEQYLALLADDIGHQHLPYDDDDTRHPDGKELMREGMTYYLGAHTAYSAELVAVTYNNNVVIIHYQSASKAIHPQTKEVIDRKSNTIEVLEIENGLVSVIRKYID